MSRARPFYCRLSCLVFLAFVLFTGSAFAEVQVKVDTTAKGREINNRMFGVNTQVWDKLFTAPETEKRIEEAGIRCLRFPGGSTSDTYDWRRNMCYNYKTGVMEVKPMSVSFDQFAAIASRLKTAVYITVNYGSGTPEEAAEWVKYSNVTHHYGFKYWEIGNECYGSWEYDTHKEKWDPLTYARQAKIYIDKMKAVDPSIKIGVVVEEDEDSLDAKAPVHEVVNPRTGEKHHGWNAVVLSTLKSEGVVPDFVIYHRYPQKPGKESDAKLLSGIDFKGRTWAQDSAEIRRNLVDYLGPAGAGVEMDVTENNSVYSHPGKQTTSLVNGLFLADSFGQLLQTQFKSFIWWALHNGVDRQNNNSAKLYGWRDYGDYGILASHGHSVKANSPYPTYHVMKLLSRFARGGDTLVEASSDDPLLSVYAVSRHDGRLSLLVVNKSETDVKDVHFSLKGFRPDSTAIEFTYGIPEDQAARKGKPDTGAARHPLSDIGAAFVTSIQPYSVNVIELRPTSNTVD